GAAEQPEPVGTAMLRVTRTPHTIAMAVSAAVATAALLSVGALAACGSADSATPQQQPTLVITGGWLFDGTGDSVVRNRGILIADSVRREVNADLAGRDFGDAHVIELADDQYIIPGLFDLHAHYALGLFGEGRVDDVVAYPAMFLANGVTSTFPAGE